VGFLQAYPHEPQFRQDYLTHQALQLQVLLKQSSTNAEMGSQQEQPQQQSGSSSSSSSSCGAGAESAAGAQNAQPSVPQMAPTLVGKHGFIQDGLLFIHKETHYELGVTPLVLLWKDQQCSRFFLETEDGNTVSNQQVATLSCHKDRTVRCLEGQVLGTLPEAFVAMQAFEDGDLVKMGLQGIDPETERVQAMNFVSKASKSRVLADTWSKIVFQHQARTGTAVTAEKLHQFLQSPPSGLDVSDVSSACQKFEI